MAKYEQWTFADLAKRCEIPLHDAEKHFTHADLVLMCYQDDLDSRAQMSGNFKL